MHRRRVNSRSNEVYKQIARLIQERGLCAGDRLPPQQELRILLRASNDSLSSAMCRLVADGVLTRRRGSGTRVRDLEPLRKIRWNVGLISPAMVEGGSSSFFSDLFHKLQVKLSRAHCFCRAYFCVDTPHWPQHRLADFPELSEDVREETLDGLMLLTNLHSKDWKQAVASGIPPCHVATWHTMPCGVVIDQSLMVQTAARLLIERGCLNPVVVDQLPPEGEKAFPLETALQRVLADSGLPRARGQTLFLYPAIQAGQDAARELLALRAKDRPDALIVIDDYTALGLTSVLAKSSNYRPPIAAITNRQFPLAFAIPVIRFEVDSNELAERAVGMLCRRMLNPSVPEVIEGVAPRLADALPGSATETVAGKAVNMHLVQTKERQVIMQNAEAK